jgi:hypothetical protein
VRGGRMVAAFREHHHRGCQDVAGSRGSDGRGSAQLRLPRLFVQLRTAKPRSGDRAKHSTTWRPSDLGNDSVEREAGSCATGAIAESPATSGWRHEPNEASGNGISPRKSRTSPARSGGPWERACLVIQLDGSRRVTFRDRRR